MVDLGIFSDIAYAALALLVAALAIYLSLRLFGKIAKFLITLVVILLALWFLFSDHSILQTLVSFARGLRDNMDKAGEITSWFGDQ